MTLKEKQKALTNIQRSIAILVLLIFISAISLAYIKIGIAPLLIIGVPGVFAYWLWFSKYLKNPLPHSIILPPFLLTVAGFNFHAIEEYIGRYSQAISRIFNFAWTGHSFFIVMLILNGGLFLVAIGLYYRKSVAGFIAILFTVTRFAEILLFIFPLIKPQIQPEIKESVSQYISGTLVTDMPNYYFAVTHTYYFPGMLTWILTLVPAIYLIYRILRPHPKYINSGLEQ